MTTSPSPRETSPHQAAIIAGGISLIVAALAFVGVFSYLAANFDYPQILDGSAAEVLPRLLAGGGEMRAVWAIYAVLPLLLIPGAVGAYFAFPSSRAAMMMALVSASLGAFAMCLGLMRWPSIHWALAEAHVPEGVESLNAINGLFTGLNLYLGNYIGEFLGEVALAAFFGLSARAAVRERRIWTWLGWAGVAFSVLFVVGAFRNVTTSVQPIADLNNSLLPVWIVVLGVTVLRTARRPTQSASMASVAAERRG